MQAKSTPRSISWRRKTTGEVHKTVTGIVVGRCCDESFAVTVPVLATVVSLPGPRSLDIQPGMED